MTIDKASVERVAEIISKENVRFINLQFTDLMGIVKQITIFVEHWSTAVDHGIWFDGSSIEGFARIAEGDMYLVPDLDTFAVIPWNREDMLSARVICDLYTPDGKPFDGDPRTILKRALAKAAEMGADWQRRRTALRRSGVYARIPGFRCLGCVFLDSVSKWVDRLPNRT